MRLRSCSAAAMLAATLSSAGPALSSSLVINGDFSAGNSGFSSDYAFRSPINGETQYNVVPGKHINDSTSNSYGDWTAITSDPSGGNGNVLIANGATSPGERVWDESVSVKPFTNYVFSFYAADVNYTSASNADILASINGTALGSPLATTQSWQSASYNWSSGKLSGGVTLALIDTNTQAAFNDFALDFISMSPAVSSTPLPAALPLFVSSLGIAGAALWRRRRVRQCSVAGA